MAQQPWLVRIRPTHPTVTDSFIRWKCTPGRPAKRYRKNQEATIVVDVMQKLQVAHGMGQPEEKAQTMAAADLLEGRRGRHGLLSEYMTDMLTRSEKIALEGRQRQRCGHDRHGNLRR